MLKSQNIKKLPCAFEAEQIILGIILSNPKTMPTANDSLMVNDFFVDKHQIIFATMQTLFQQNKNIDYISLLSLLKDKTLLAKIGGLEYLIDLSNLIPEVKHLDNYITLLKEAALKRELIMISGEITNQGYQDISLENYLDLAENKISQLKQKQTTNNFLPVNQLLKTLQAKIKAQSQADTDVLGLKTGFESLDNITLGFKPEELIIVASRPAMGKSTLMMNLMLKMSEVNASPPHIVVFSLEMANEQIVTRILSHLTNINHQHIQISPHLNTYDLKKIQQQSDILSQYKIFLDDGASLSVHDIKAKCRQLKAKNQLDIVMIDYLQLIHHNANKYNRQEEIAMISRNLKQLARELKIPIIALSQLSREVEKREDKRPILSDLRDSGSIEQDADVVCFLYRDDYYQKNKNDWGKKPVVDVDLIISKNRNGVIGIKKMTLDLSILKFQEVNF